MTDIERQQINTYLVLIEGEHLVIYISQ